MLAASVIFENKTKKLLKTTKLIKTDLFSQNVGFDAFTGRHSQPERARETERHILRDSTTAHRITGHYFTVMR